MPVLPILYGTLEQTRAYGLIAGERNVRTRLNALSTTIDGAFPDYWNFCLWQFVMAEGPPLHAMHAFLYQPVLIGWTLLPLRMAGILSCISAGRQDLEVHKVGGRCLRHRATEQRTGTYGLGALIAFGL